MAVSIGELGKCLRESGEPEASAEEFKRSLQILETKLGRENMEYATMLYESGWSIRESGRPREARPVLERTLKIMEAQVCVCSVCMCVRCCCLGCVVIVRCMLPSGWRTSFSEQLFTYLSQVFQILRWW